MNCNICGKEFDKRDLITKKTEIGTEYCICRQCDENGVNITETTDYYICKQCGYPHQKDQLKKTCIFCGSHNNFEKVELTAVEEEMLDTEPQKLYKEKLGEDVAQNIANWIESPQRAEVGIRHKRDRLIDTATLVGMLITYFLIGHNKNNFAGQKSVTIALIIPTILVLITGPLFKKADKKPRKKPLPIWSIYVIMAILIAIYILIAKISRC